MWGVGGHQSRVHLTDKQFHDSVYYLSVRSILFSKLTKYVKTQEIFIFYTL